MFLSDYKPGEDWYKVTKKVSEDTGSKDNGGDLGWFGEV
jgi:parvulin-like peptidyl-prolyl isomerase